MENVEGGSEPTGSPFVLLSDIVETGPADDFQRVIERNVYSGRRRETA
jgi:hypothetical protein